MTKTWKELIRSGVENNAGVRVIVEKTGCIGYSPSDAEL